ncbi:MAG: BLUF domain-containing protein [Ekhidna sp.]|nr:BLUF domain-containing protein [Ekhidna sp.]
MIYYTIYTSTPVEKITESVLDNITEVSMKWNKEHQITGMLLALEDRFIQFLEGDDEEVKSIFEKIKEDKRHNNVIRKIQGYSNDRVFQEWSMGSWMLSNQALQELSAMDDLKGFLQDPVNASLQSARMVTMMNNLLKTWIAHEPERTKKLKG